MNPDYPVYVISKGRWESRLTAKTLIEMQIPFRIVVEPQELEQYAAVIDRTKILALPFSNLGFGSIPARNWVWNHAISEGHARHWILDDNIDGFFRPVKKRMIPVKTGNIFRAMEDLARRYTNVAVCGPQYSILGIYGSPSQICKTPVVINTRVYSCILIRNDIPYRWRGRYNEDTDLSLRILKDGWCTILFNEFRCGKIGTMTMKGGNTESLYKLGGGVDGRLIMAQSLQQQHPDVCTITRKWGRWQHHVDYRPFKRNKLILKPEFVGKKWEPNEYGMKLVTVDNTNV